MKKIKMLLALYEALDTNSYISIAVKSSEMEKAEIIINPPSNIKAKMRYYSEAYNDALELERNKDIQIIAYAKGKSDMEALVNISHKIEGVIC